MVNKPNNDKEFVILKSLTWHVEERDIRICIKGNLLIVAIFTWISFLIVLVCIHQFTQFK